MTGVTESCDFGQVKMPTLGDAWGLGTFAPAERFNGPLQTFAQPLCQQPALWSMCRSLHLGIASDQQEDFERKRLPRKFCLENSPNC